MKKIGVALVALVVASAVVWRLFSGHDSRAPVESHAPPIVELKQPAPLLEASPLPTESILTRATPGPDARTGGSPLATELNAPGNTGQQDVEVLHELLRQYLRRLHSRQGVPIGNDSDLLRALTGDNPMKLVVLPPTHPAAGADGRLRDRWGKPYFVHPRGNGAYELRSAGPDRVMFTADDAVANPAPAAVTIEEER